MKKDDRYNTERRTEVKPNKGVTFTLNGCLYIIILAAIATMAVKGCKMVNMKYEEQAAKHALYMDSINKVKQDTIHYGGR